MKPDKVNILGVEYKIIYCDKPSDVDVFKRNSLWGQLDYWTRTIRIYDSDRPAEDIWQCIFHEVLHGIAELLHLQYFEDENNHEELDLLALALADVLFRNEWMKP
jgi:hypothetical protein